MRRRSAGARKRLRSSCTTRSICLPQPPPAAPERAARSRKRPRRAPVRFGLGLRKTRENFLARIRAAITGSAKADEIYEGLEEALIGADVGVEASLKLVEAVRARLKNDAPPRLSATRSKKKSTRDARQPNARSPTPATRRW